MALSGDIAEKEGPEPQLLQEEVKAPIFIPARKTGTVEGSFLVLWPFRQHPFRAQAPIPRGPTSSFSLWTMCSADLSRWPLRPPCAGSRAVPSHGKGTSTCGTPFLCIPRHPARSGLIPPQSEQRPWPWGLLHSPAVCTPPGHHSGPSCHHRWCPRSPGEGSPLGRHRDGPHPPGGAVHCLRRESQANGVFTQGHRRVFWFCGTPHLSSWPCSPLRLQSLPVQTQSHTRAAPGSAFLWKQQWSEC